MSGSELAAEICHRNRELAANSAHGHLLSAGGVVLYHPDAGLAAHGNFYPAAWRAMQRRPDWQRRLAKVHAQAGGVRGPDGQRPERRVRELDSCTSSDALLMNVFCAPGAVRAAAPMLHVEPDADPRFGVRARVPLANGNEDTTEIDLRLGDLFLEAKLTESDFQAATLVPAQNLGRNKLPSLLRYRDFEEVFDPELLPARDGVVRCYQLCRNVLAVHAHGGRFCALVDARRNDLMELVSATQRAIRLYELRTRVTVATWQEISYMLPAALRRWLGAKYGIA